ncbi:spartin a isoform X2 [Pseudorasbora parva]|uniref:spartin a isoform X2 n=1 Tax=Pseudorasbora parva TaxID=51549 RepID=UPI00351E4423
MESSDPALRAIRESYGKALECLNSGLRCDEGGNKEQALLLYKLGRRHLLMGLGVNTRGARTAHARHTQLRMKETLSSISSRIQELSRPPPSLHPPVRSAAGQASPAELPPAYTPEPTDGHLSLSHGAHRAFQAAPNAAGPRGAGTEILFLPRGVQMFFVSAEGRVSAPSYPGYLRVLIHSSPDSAPAYLQVCDWIYPLYPDSPVLLSNRGVFTFPDTTAAVPGSYVGIVLSSDLPAADRELFQEQLAELAQLRVQVDEEQGGATGSDPSPSEKVPPLGTAEAEEKTLPVWSEKMSQSILAGSSWLGRGLVRGGEATGKAIQRGASKLRENITPEETPAEVSPKVTKGLNAARTATGGAVRVSQFLVDGVAAVTGRVGKELAPHVKKHGSKLVPESLKKNKDGCSKMDGAKLVAGSSLQGFSTLWSSLETAAKTIGKSLTSETVTTVRHKFRGLGNLLDAPGRI